MTTLVIDGDELAGEEVWVADERYRHLFRARRLAVDDRLRVVDGAGGARSARVARVERRRALLRLEGAAPANEAHLALTLVVAPPRLQRAAWLVEKATELGVVAVRFVAAERSPRRYGTPTLARLRRVAVAAVEQAERALVPEVTGVHPWPELAALLEPAPERRFLDPGAQRWRPLPGGAAEVALLVGPEGGWTAAERRRLGELHCRPAGLGKSVLRVETAAVAGTALALLPGGER